MTYFITGLPRSRTTWFSAYFDCDHDLSAVYSPSDIAAHFGKGLSDSGLMFYPHPLPGPTVIIHRRVEDVRRSLLKYGVDHGDLLWWAKRRLENMPGLHVQFDDIDARLREITEYVGETWDSARADRFMKMRIEPASIQGADTTEDWLCQHFGAQ